MGMAASPSIATVFIPTILVLSFLHSCASECESWCGQIPIRYPFGIDDGCGSPYYRRLLICSDSILHLRTPSGTYTVLNVSYSADPHLVVSDPSMWSCLDSKSKVTDSQPAPPPFSLDASTHLTLSPKNEFMFLNCSSDAILIGPKPKLCEKFPDRCGSICDSAGYLCREPPVCPEVMRESGLSCCTYYPESIESTRLMLRHCKTYTSVHWNIIGSGFSPYDQLPEYGIRIDFEIPVTTRCLRCNQNGRGTCGFDVQTQNFLCLCKEQNLTTACGDGVMGAQENNVGVIVGAVSVVCFVGFGSGGVLIWFLKKLKTNRVASGVQSNENRLF